MNSLQSTSLAIRSLGYILERGVPGVDQKLETFLYLRNYRNRRNRRLYVKVWLTLQSSKADVLINSDDLGVNHASLP